MDDTRTSDNERTDILITALLFICLSLHLLIAVVNHSLTSLFLYFLSSHKVQCLRKVFFYLLFLQIVSRYELKLYLQMRQLLKAAGCTEFYLRYQIKGG